MSGRPSRSTSAASTPMLACARPPSPRSQPRRCRRRSTNVPVAVLPEVVRHRVVRDVDVDVAVEVEVERDHSEPVGRERLVEPELRGRVDEAASRVLEEHVRLRHEAVRAARHLEARGSRTACRRSGASRGRASTYRATNRSRSPSPSASKNAAPVVQPGIPAPGALRHVLELPPAEVAEQARAAERGQEEIGPPVAVVVGGVGALEPPAEPEPGLRADRGEAEGRVWPGRARSWDRRPAGSPFAGVAVADEQVEVAVAVVVERRRALAEALEDRRLLVDVAVDVLERDPRAGRDVRERHRRGRRTALGGRRASPGAGLWRSPQDRRRGARRQRGRPARPVHSPTKTHCPLVTRARSCRSFRRPLDSLIPIVLMTRRADRFHCWTSCTISSRFVVSPSVGSPSVRKYTVSMPGLGAAPGPVVPPSPFFFGR